MAKRKVAKEADAREDRVTPDEDIGDIVALLRRSWTVPQALATGACGRPRLVLDRFTIEDPAFRSFGH